MSIPIIDVAATGRQIQHKREQANLSVKDVQELCGFANPTAIYHWQTGTALPSLDNLIILAWAFQTSVDDLIVLKK